MTFHIMDDSTGAETADGELLARYRSGDLDSFRQLYDRHKKPLFLYILGITRDQGVAEDILQEAFLRLLDEAASPSLIPRGPISLRWPGTSRSISAADRARS